MRVRSAEEILRMQEYKEWSLNYNKTNQYKSLFKIPDRSGIDRRKNAHILSEVHKDVIQTPAPQLNFSLSQLLYNIMKYSSTPWLYSPWRTLGFFKINTYYPQYLSLVSNSSISGLINHPLTNYSYLSLGLFTSFLPSSLLIKNS